MPAPLEPPTLAEPSTDDETVLDAFSAGLRLTAAEFDAAEFEPGNGYQLVRGVLVVSPSPLPPDRRPNGLLEFYLRLYAQWHPQGGALDDMLTKHTLALGEERRRCDRAIWAGLGRQPEPDEWPTIAIEFVSAGKRRWRRDFIEKRQLYLDAGIAEYWVFSRFDRAMTVFRQGAAEPQMIRQAQTYQTPLLPGFELPLEPMLDAVKRFRPEK